MEAATGRLIGNYRVGRLLGQGGMGSVYEAEHAALRLPCALKVFAADGAKKEFLRKRFLAEGRLLARLDHPRLVKVRDLAVDEASGVPYFAMDLVLDGGASPAMAEGADADSRDQPSVLDHEISADAPAGGVLLAT